MSNIILWGTGQIANKIINLINERIVLVVDNDEKKWGTIWNGYVISKPSGITGLNGNFDRIIIATESWKDIREEVVKDFHIDPMLIDNMYYRQKEALLKSYEKSEMDDKAKYISYLRQNPLEVFNDEFSSKYNRLDIDVYFDESSSLYYVYHVGKKMFFSRKMNTVELVKKCYSSLLREQDKRSPHRYLTEDFCVKKGDVVLDAGVAEGNFATEVVDLADKIFLVESDKDWVEALRCTFAPYKEKVEIIEGVLGGGDSVEITIDSIIGNGKVDFIKMDIEGAEVRALYGAKGTLERNNVKLDICAYHNFDDEKKIRHILNKYGYRSEASEGYMVFINEKFYEKKVFCPKFVRGLVRGYKQK